jgi:glycosyltransferase involved in cell wall biosynthesis
MVVEAERSRARSQNPKSGSSKSIGHAADFALACLRMSNFRRKGPRASVWWPSMTLCLTMIVRNEAATLARCLASAKHLIDCWIIIDTGSTDETMTIVMRELSHLPGDLYSRPWVNFGHNRTESLTLTREWLSKNNYDLNATWCLMLDADHELENHGFVASELTHDSYLVDQHDQQVTYSNARLLRASIAWRSEGVTHEYWTGPGNRERLPSLSIHDHNDGGSRGDKFVRDERLLRHGLIDEPNNERYMFYLAQTCESLGKADEAIEWYRKRTKAGGFEEERWMAQLRLGRILLNQNEAAGVRELLVAFDERPLRAEPLYTLARYYRDRGKNQLAHLFAKRAQVIPKSNDALFVEHPVYERGISEELSIVSYYAGDMKTGILACESLLVNAPEQDELVESNLAFYAQPLAGEHGTYYVPEELRTFDGTLYNCSNPSICDDVVLVRLVNYDQQHGRWYVSRDGDGRIRTRNAISRNGELFTIIDESILRDWNQDSRILGLEDIRLVAFEGRLHFTATCCQVPHAGGNPQVVLGRLSKDLRSVDHLVPIDYVGRRGVEKNWLLWPHEDKLRCVYSFSPFTWWTQRLDGSVENVHVGQPWSYAGRLRGSVPAVPIDSGRTLFITHDVAHRESYNVYMHRFVVVSGVTNGTSRIRISAPFLLEHSGIEYACGATAVADDLVISYGYEDREAHWLRIARPFVLKRMTEDISREITESGTVLSH